MAIIFNQRGQPIDSDNPFPVALYDEAGNPVTAIGLAAGATVSVAGSSVVEGSAETITVSSTAIPLTTVPATAAGAFITVETNSVRFWIDGSTPTAAVGHLVGAGDTIMLDSRAKVTAFRAIRAGGADATIQVSYTA